MDPQYIHPTDVRIHISVENYKPIAKLEELLKQIAMTVVSHMGVMKN